MDYRQQEQKRMGDVLVKARKAQGFTQRDVASYMDVDPSTYCGWEIGRRAIPIHLVMQLCNHLRLTVEELFDDV